MKRFKLSFLTCLFLLCSAVVVTQEASAQEQGPSAAERAATLRLQLVDVQQKEGDLQLRLQQLDEDLKPENIERAMAGYGSTRPEELREQRRKQLEIEKKSVVGQLEQLAISRTQLEAAIVNADALAYQQSAKGYPVNQVAGSRTELRGILIAGSIAAIGVLGLLLLVRRWMRNQV